MYVLIIYPLFVKQLNKVNIDFTENMLLPTFSIDFGMEIETIKKKN